MGGIHVMAFQIPVWLEPVMITVVTVCLSGSQAFHRTVVISMKRVILIMGKLLFIYSTFFALVVNL